MYKKYSDMEIGMIDIITSKKYREFYNSVFKNNASIEEVVELINKNVGEVAKELHIGKILCTMESDIPQHISLDKKDPYKNVQFHSGADFDDRPECFTYNTGDRQKAIVSVYPIKGYCWNDCEIEEIEFLCKNIYAICGRTRLIDIADKATYYDRLTGLHNINSFTMTGGRLCYQRLLANYTAMYLNIKNFKYIDTKYGNKAGDLALAEYGRFLKGYIREDEAVCRLGGDNFTFLIKKERKQEAIKDLSCVRLNIALPTGKIEIDIRSRIGVYDITEADDISSVMNSISAAINAAKQSHTEDVVVFNKSIMDNLEMKHQITSDFPKALANEEFVVYYQPKIDLNSNEMCGCEALVRWKKDDKIIPPGLFIPTLEYDGAICSLDFYMLDRVCRDIKKWEEEGIEPVTVSVNFSKIHLHNPNIADNILSIVKKHDIDSRYIEIELTEMSDYDDCESLKTLVQKMKENGVMTSIDDFGTGFSSLNLLTDFMFDIVKLDKSFIDNIIKHNDSTDEIVIRNIVKMVKELNMKAVAEGVETVEQATLLKSLGCNIVQGYLYDRPLCHEDFTKRLRDRKYSINKIE